VIVRPSGTEPKVKCYLEVVVPVDPSTGSGTASSDGGVDAARIAAVGRLDAIRSDLQKAAGL
jgi:phosphomannomutase